MKKNEMRNGGYKNEKFQGYKPKQDTKVYVEIILQRLSRNYTLKVSKCTTKFIVKCTTKFIVSILQSL
jgi:hypothetical protein